jgi:predicted Zn-dependent protease
MFKKSAWVVSVILIGLSTSVSLLYGQGDGLPTELKVMKTELARNFEALKKQSVPPYYLSYSLDRVRTQRVSASFGALSEKTEDTTAYLRIGLRVGSCQLDNSHELRGDPYARYRSYYSGFKSAPLHEAPQALSVLLWQETDRSYKDAVEMLAKIKTERNLKAAEEDQSDDFSVSAPNASVEKPLAVEVDLDRWAAQVRKFSAPFQKGPHILSGYASFQSEVRNKYFVDTDGSVILTPVNYMRLSIRATTKAEDGMELPLYLSYFGYQEADLPPEGKVLADIDRLIATLEQLRTAPLVDPFMGPALLSGRSSGVFFHEILGHRLEGHRQKSEEEGQTFKKKVGEKILPEFISVTFDPTRRDYQGLVLSGYYRFDDEGTKAERVGVIENGVLKGFLMSRSPIAGFPRSNGHARCQPGITPVSRQSNLIVGSTRVLSEAKLRERMIAECRRQNKPFGLLFKEIEGGFTMTGREVPNAFTVLPLLVYKVYADGRPDEVVRGVDLIGTPLTTFSKIVATGSEVEAFNGTCGAESGGVPVSAVSPSILVSQIEVQKKAKSQEKPPILPPPGPDKSPEKGGQP